MTMWTPDLNPYAGPRYRAIADALEADLREGRLAPGARLPTHRELAERLGVTVGTITRAYAEAEARGLTRGTVGRGTFVRETRVQAPVMIHAPAPGLIDLSVNRPALLPQIRALQQTLTELPATLDLAALLNYAPTCGLPAHRAAGAGFIAMLGLPGYTTEQIVITCGAQHALLAVLMAMAEPGDVLLTEALAYPGLIAAASQARLRVVPVAIDEHGLIPEALREAAREHRPKLLATVATLHNPTTAVLPAARRAGIAEIAREFDFALLDDDVYGFLVPERPPALASFAPERSCYVTCTSKALMPGLRIGYVAAPSAWAERISAAVRTSVWMAPPLMAEIAARWIAEGTAERLMDWQREEIRARQQLAAGRLAAHPYRAQPGGFHLWLPLPEPWREGEFVAAARARGVAVAPAEVFAVGRQPTPPAVRVCVSAQPDRESLAQGLDVLAGLLAQPPSAPLLM